MLGYHAKASEKSTLVYSRDVMAWPMRHLGRAFMLIREGYFNPDSTRFGFWIKQPPSTGAEAFEFEVQRMDRKLALLDTSRGDVAANHLVRQRAAIYRKAHHPFLVGHGFKEFLGKSNRARKAS